MDYAVWNTLHDGSIESIGGVVPGDVAIQVGIAYLCEKLPTTANYLVVHLRGCTRFEYQPFDGETDSDLAHIVASDVEILSAKEVQGLVSVVCVNGFLKLAYNRTEISLAEGTVVSQSELEAAAKRYWTEWEEKIRQARG